MLRIFAILFLFIICCCFPKFRSLAGVIRSHYGNHVLNIIRKYDKLDYKICKLSIDNEFLNNCLNHNLCPTFLKYEMSSKRLQTSDAQKISKSIFIHQEIMFKTLEIEKVCAQFNKMKDNLRSFVSLIGCILLIHLRKAILKL